MKKISDKLLALMTLAAELRAAGSSWARIAQELDRSAETCRQWPARHPETWRRLFRRAAADCAAEGGADAHQSLRLLVRHADPKVSLRAAQLLQRGWLDQMDREDRAERPDPAKVAVEIVEFAKLLKGLTDEQLARHLADYLARRPVARTAPGTTEDIELPTGEKTGLPQTAIPQPPRCHVLR